MSYDQDEEHNLKYLPRNKKRGGWEGDEMELQHARDHKKKSIIRDEYANDSSSSKHGNSVAVNIQDFYNNEVGKGYQAKHVIRQPHLNPHPQVNITDMSKPVTKPDSSSAVVVGNNSNRKENNPNTYTTLDALLKNQRLRAFRKEVEKIYLEASNKTRNT
jgi:hypothetical protein